MEAIKVTSAEWLMSNMGEPIERFAKKLGIPGLHAPSLFSYFAWVAQYGGDGNELWVVFENDKPVAFAQWNVLGLPHVSKVYMGFLHSWATTSEPVSILTEKYFEFGDRFNATWFTYDPSSEKHVAILERRLNRRGHKLLKTGIINCMSWKVSDENTD